jgi:hypothetical protein
LEDRDATSATSLLDVERREIHYDMVTALVAQRKKVSEEFLEEALGLRT